MIWRLSKTLIYAIYVDQNGSKIVTISVKLAWSLAKNIQLENFLKAPWYKTLIIFITQNGLYCKGLRLQPMENTWNESLFSCCKLCTLQQNVASSDTDIAITWHCSVSVFLELTESKMIVHHFGPPPDGYIPGQHRVTQVMKQVPKRNRCHSTQQGEQKVTFNSTKFL